MALIASIYPENTLTQWSAYCALINKVRCAQDIGFALSTADVNRFAARYRVARSFQGITLAGFSPNTVLGYNSLFRVFLMWSAFERFLQVMGHSQNSIEPNLAAYKPQVCLAAISADEIGKTFYEFVAPRVDSKHQIRLQQFADHTLTNPTYLASAVRHLFAHGHLTAHAGGSSPERVDQVCTILFDFHMAVMDGEFTRVIRDFKTATGL